MSILPSADRLPWWAATLAGLAAIAVYAVVPTSWTAWTLLGAIAVAALCVDVLGHRQRSSVLTGSLVAVWICAVSLALPVLGIAGGIFAVAVLSWMALAIGWRMLGVKHKWIAALELKIDHRRSLGLIRGHWDKFARQSGFSEDSKLVKAEPTDTGVELDVLVPGDASAVAAKTGGIASTLGVGKDRVHVTTDPEHAGIAHIAVQTVDPLATKPSGWMAPSDEYSIRFGMVVGPGADGQPVRVDFVGEHHQVTGITRSGKTHYLQLAAAHFAYAPDAELVVIDTVKRGADFQRWEHAAAMYAIDANAAAYALERIYELMQQRYAWRRRMRHTGQWRPGQEGPQIGVVLDEAANACRTNEVQDLLMLLAAESSGAGITLIVGTQSPQHRIFDVNTRRNLGTKVALATDSSQASDLALDAGWAGLGYDCSRLPKGGHCFVRHTGDNRPTRARIWWVEDDRLDQTALRLPATGHTQPHPALSDQSAVTTAPETARTSLAHLAAADEALAQEDVATLPADVDRHPESTGVAPADVADPQNGRRETPGGPASGPSVLDRLIDRTGLQYTRRAYVWMVTQDPVSQTALARELRCTSRTAARTLQRMVDVGLARKAGDRWAAIPERQLRAG